MLLLFVFFIIMTQAITIIDGRGLSNNECCEFLPKNSKICM